ncbi:DUF1963 domain-containing protein [Nocardia sp. 004]|uniref:DUF1963 domain-containing protein n=1 Tax=Nocardia sp. 004 TaxID=3385978 RepID=UPI00399F4FC4
MSEGLRNLRDMVYLPGSLDIDVFAESLRSSVAYPESFDRWRSSAEYAIALHDADRHDGPLVGQTGGVPELPLGVEWPVWDGSDQIGYGVQPLHFVARVDCAALPDTAAKLGYPTEGTLLFFHFDDERLGQFVLPRPGNPAYPDGFRVIYVGADEVVESRPAPDGLEIYEPCGLVAEVIQTMYEVPCRYEDTASIYKALVDPFSVAEPDAGQLAGIPASMQDPVEEEVAEAVANGLTDPALRGSFDEDGEWVLLASFYYERHDGLLYYLIQPDDLTARRFDKVMFTSQCT